MAAEKKDRAAILAGLAVRPELREALTRKA
jgi:hypothetical protein